MSEGEVRRAASDMVQKVLANPERYQEAVVILARGLYYLAQEHGRRITDGRVKTATDLHEFTCVLIRSWQCLSHKGDTSK